MTQIMRQEAEPLAIHANPIQAMLSAVIEKGITAENAAAVEKITDLFLKVEASNAKKAFALAKSELQAELPVVIANKTVPNNDGTTRYVYAPFEDIMRQIKPF
jgi:hypothetical protein